MLIAVASATQRIYVNVWMWAHVIFIHSFFISIRFSCAPSDINSLRQRMFRHSRTAHAAYQHFSYPNWYWNNSGRKFSAGNYNADGACVPFGTSFTWTRAGTAVGRGCDAEWLNRLIRMCAAQPNVTRFTVNSFICLPSFHHQSSFVSFVFAFNSLCVSVGVLCCFALCATALLLDLIRKFEAKEKKTTKTHTHKALAEMLEK